MVLCCAVKGCKRKADPGSGVPFHRIPVNRRDLWIAAMKLDSNVSKFACICGKHFKEEDYITPLKSKLKPEAVPSILNPKMLLNPFEYITPYISRSTENNNDEYKPSEIDYFESDVDDANDQEANVGDQEASLGDQADSDESDRTYCSDVSRSGSREKLRLDGLCRTCLCNDRTLCDISTQDELTFQDVFNAHNSDWQKELPRHVCWECSARLNSFTAFKEKAKRANAVLVSLIRSNTRSTDLLTLREEHNLTSSLVTKTLHNDFADYYMEHCAEEETDLKPMLDLQQIVDNLDIKQEICVPFTDIQNLKMEQEDIQNVLTVPEIVQKTLKVSVPDIVQKPKKIQKTRNMNLNEYQENCEAINELDSDIFDVKYLSTEEQLNEIINRQHSDNYKNAGFKCNECYKGFVYEEAFNLHMIKHSDSNSSVDRGRSEIYGGFIKTSVEHISIDDTCQMEYKAIKEEPAAFDDIKDDILEPAEEILDEDYLKNDLPDTVSHLSKADSEDDIPLIKFTTQVEKEQNRGPTATVPKLQDEEEQKKNESSHSKMIRNTYSSSSKFVTKSNKTLKGNQRSLNRVTNFKRYNTHVGDKSYKCEICQRCFSESFRLANHMRIHTGENPYKCDICQRGFVDKSNLTKHIRIHTGEKPNECKICQRGFAHKSDLAKHVRIHTGEKPYECKICQRGFTQKSHLAKHVRIHTGEKPYECKICQRGFAHKSDLAKHVRIHTGEKPYECKICQRCFTQKGHLAIHVRIHTGEKPYKCNVCQRCFTQKGDLAKHVRIHTGEKPYECKICQHGFAHKSDLAKHVRIHTGEKPYECKICQRGFTQKSHLANHVCIHTGEKPYKCNICQRCFTQKADLAKHVRIHTGEKPYKCNICQRGFVDKSNLTEHIRVHNGEKP